MDRLIREGLGDHLKKTTGLVPGVYFSGTKIAWILDQMEGARSRARKGEILFETVDTGLIWKLTNGKVHATDYTNASRTMLPELKPSGSLFGTVAVQGVAIPLAGMRGISRPLSLVNAVLPKERQKTPTEPGLCKPERTVDHHRSGPG